MSLLRELIEWFLSYSQQKKKKKKKMMMIDHVHQLLEWEFLVVILFLLFGLVPKNYCGDWEEGIDLRDNLDQMEMKLKMIFQKIVVGRRCFGGVERGWGRLVEEKVLLLFVHLHHCRWKMEEDHRKNYQERSVLGGKWRRYGELGGCEMLWRWVGMWDKVGRGEVKGKKLRKWKQKRKGKLKKKRTKENPLRGSDLDLGFSSKGLLFQNELFLPLDDIKNYLFGFLVR